MNYPLVSIVIPTHNRKKMVLRLLMSIVQGSYKNIEVIIIDDASTDATTEALKKFCSNNSRIQLIRNTKNLFAAGSRNIGIEISKGKYIFFLDDDNVLDRFAISELVAVFEKDPQIGELGLVNYNLIDKKILWARTKRNMWTSKTNQSRNLDEFADLDIWDTDDVPNAYIVKADILKKYSIFFHEKFGIMYEESDLAYRIRNVGYSVRVVKNAKIYHDIDSIESDGKKKDYMYHFMTDDRRVYVFARNRIIFHSIYSNQIQLFTILFFGIWIFTIYYSYKILLYTGAGTFLFTYKMRLISRYLQGDIDGLKFVLGKKVLI